MERRYTPISAASYKAHRSALRELLPPKALVVIHSNDVLPSNADGILPFVQNSNLFYFTGIDQPETTLVLAYEAAEEAWREILFLKTPTASAALWEGEGFDAKSARAQSGIDQVYYQDSFESVFYKLMVQSDQVFIENNEHHRANNLVETQNDRFIKSCQLRYPLHAYKRLSPLVSRLRASKSSEELIQIRQACAITREGLGQVARYLKPGVKEYELEAEFIHSFVRQGAEGFAYTPIIATGKNACVLHYTNNSSVCQKDELVLMDVGARYGNYHADLTRCFPVSGRFTKRQRTLYDSVLRAQRYAMSLLKPGLVLSNYQSQVEEFVLEELCSLELVSAAQARKNPTKARVKYFMHGVSHHLGLDVHDVPSSHDPLLVGAVLTVEPGLYIPEEGIGIRLENDVVITDQGIQDLTQDIPLEVEEIETFMAS